MIHKIKAMYDGGQGLSIRAISRELNVSRNTVKKYLAMNVEDICAIKTDPAREKWLDQYRYYEPIIETVPGVQCQVDPGELRGVLINGKPHTVYFVAFVLSYSRLMYVGLSLQPLNTQRFIEMHDEAFRYFGGVTEECVYDQTKLVVLSEEYRELKLNQRFAHYATAASFHIHVCEGFDPESKGKVEAGTAHLLERKDLTASKMRDYIDAWFSAEQRGRMVDVDDDNSVAIDLSMYRRISHVNAQRSLS